jgi:hypothetical protein
VFPPLMKPQIPHILLSPSHCRVDLRRGAVAMVDPALFPQQQRGPRRRRRPIAARGSPARVARALGISRDPARGMAMVARARADPARGLTVAARAQGKALQHRRQGGGPSARRGAASRLLFLVMAWLSRSTSAAGTELPSGRADLISLAVLASLFQIHVFLVIS